jgi:hypothetical protein
MFAINKFRHYIIGYPIFVHKYHSTIKYLANKPITCARVMRWLLLIQEFDITIIDKPGKDNVVAVLLYRLIVNTNNSPIEDSFPNEHLIAVSSHRPWYADIVNYLATGKLSHHVSLRERQNIIQWSVIFSWIDECLFCTGAYLIIRRYVREDEIQDILKVCHDGPYGGHFADIRTSHKTLHMGYYWPTVF